MRERRASGTAVDVGAGPGSPRGGRPRRGGVRARARGGASASVTRARATRIAATPCEGDERGARAARATTGGPAKPRPSKPCAAGANEARRRHSDQRAARRGFFRAFVSSEPFVSFERRQHRPPRASSRPSVSVARAGGTPARDAPPRALECNRRVSPTRPRSGASRGRPVLRSPPRPPLRAASNGRGSRGRRFPVPSSNPRASGGWRAPPPPARPPAAPLPPPRTPLAAPTRRGVRVQPRDGDAREPRRELRRGGDQDPVRGVRRPRRVPARVPGGERRGRVARRRPPRRPPRRLVRLAVGAAAVLASSDATMRAAAVAGARRWRGWDSSRRASSAASR